MNDDQAMNDLRTGLPYAFELAENEAQRISIDSMGMARLTTGQEVGIHRERVILGFLISKLGEIAVRLPSPGDAQADVLVGGSPLEIKTVTGRGDVTAKWTADTASAQHVIDTFAFRSDMWLVRIWWDRTETSVYYIPREVLQDGTTSIPDFLRSATGTNNRGVRLSRQFMDLVQSDERTTSIQVDWRRSGRPILSPIVKYTQFWLNREYRSSDTS
ncbi:MAG: hypothetical protein F4X40_04760 [Chloroflexi bacterium]|nr:hypothetical protein [Chloroflexota bacterium]